jgi:hypothetical protein
MFGRFRGMSKDLKYKMEQSSAFSRMRDFKNKINVPTASMNPLKKLKLKYNLNDAQFEKAREFKKSLIDSFASGESKTKLTEAETQTITESLKKKIPNIFKKFDEKKRKIIISKVGEALKTAGAGAALAAGTLVISPFILVGLILTAVAQLHYVMVNGGSKTRRRRKKAKKNRKTHKRKQKRKTHKRKHKRKQKRKTRRRR